MQPAIRSVCLVASASAHTGAEWIYFLTAVNRSMTGQDVLVDNGEAIDSHFVW